jgi:hypothetical protein
MTDWEQVVNVANAWMAYVAAHRIGAGATAFAVALLLQTVLIVWLLRRVGRLAWQADRIKHLTDGLALLTDTTEAGLTTLLREVERIGQRPAPVRATRKSVATRVVTAAHKGEPVAEIAGREAMSESEVRLHLMLANVQQRKRAMSRATA